MRFLKVDCHGNLSITGNLQNPPAPYAILSHRWYEDEDEVTFKNWDLSDSRDKPGYAKLLFCAERARSDNLEYFWVDTCCIDRTNAVELDEAIRSMFRWYQCAEMCYVYLSDVETNNGDRNQTSPWKLAFRRSTWFERGWTLQELLAPKSVEFFSKDNRHLGNKTTLEQEIHEITGIPIEALRGDELSRFSVEERFQWAKKRETKKPEDKAYCLFGIFDAILPVMYGEGGENAIKRLRDEIGITLSQIDAEIKQAYYRGVRLRVERLSGKSLALEECFVNLCVIHYKHNHGMGLRESISKASANSQTNPQLSRFSLAACLKVETPPQSEQVSITSLFDLRNRKDGSQLRPNRVLIWGGAGTGKTTLCKKMIHDFYQHGLWKDLYDRVIWLPLRRLKLMAHEAHDVVSLMKKEFSLDQSKKNLTERLKERVVHSERTLFILDGLDEVSYTEPHTSLGCVLESLLAQPHVIITSRPHTTSMLDNIPLDLELETVGFYPQQVEEYIQQTAKQTNMSDTIASEIRSFIKDRPLVRSLARIPVQLDAICYAWNTKRFPKDNVTMTTLYQAISWQLWTKDVVRKGKQVNGQPVTKQQIEQAANIEGLIEAEIAFLQELAFQGLYEEIIEFGPEHIGRLQMNQVMLGDTPVNSSFLRSSNNSLEVSDRTVHFIHLTFQEFFGARFFVRHWTSGTEILLWRSSPPGGTARQVEHISPEEFLKKEKYVGRYDIFWRFVTGLLYAEPVLSHLYRFLEALQQEPSDLVGLSHQRLMIHVLSEIGTDNADVQETVRKHENHYLQWILFELRLKNPRLRTSLMWEAGCSDYILMTLLGRTETQVQAMNVLCHRASVSSKVLSMILDAVNNKMDTNLRQTAIRAFGRHCGPVREKKFLCFWHNLREFSGPERLEVAEALQQSQNLEQPAVEALVSLLQDLEAGVQYEAASALRGQTSLPSSAITALVSLLQDPEAGVRPEAASALRGQTSLPSSAITALVSLLQDPEAGVRSEAASVLSGQTSLPSSAITALVSLLQDPEAGVRSEAASALGGQTSLPSSAITALVSLLQDPEACAGNEAVSLLASREEGYHSILSLNSLATQRILSTWLEEGSVICSIWNRSFSIEINGKQWKAPLQTRQEARLRKAWADAQKALGFPPLAVTSKRKHNKCQAELAICLSPKKRKQKQ